PFPGRGLVVQLALAFEHVSKRYRKGTLALAMSPGACRRADELACWAPTEQARAPRSACSRAPSRQPLVRSACWARTSAAAITSTLGAAPASCHRDPGCARARGRPRCRHPARAAAFGPGVLGCGGPAAGTARTGFPYGHNISGAMLGPVFVAVFGLLF